MIFQCVSETLPARQVPVRPCTRGRRRVGRPFARSIRLTALCALVTTFGYGCASETPIELPVVGPVAELGGHWEVDYARSDTCRHNQCVFPRGPAGDSPKAGGGRARASPQGMPLGDLDTLIALAKMAELVTDSDLLEIEQDPTYSALSEQIILR